jgi:hypothetical protein
VTQVFPERASLVLVQVYGDEVEDDELAARLRAEMGCVAKIISERKEPFNDSD